MRQKKKQTHQSSSYHARVGALQLIERNFAVAVNVKQIEVAGHHVKRVSDQVGLLAQPREGVVWLSEDRNQLIDASFAVSFSRRSKRALT